MMEFLATNFNLPTIIVSIIVFGGTGWLMYHEHKTGGLGCCDGSLRGAADAAVTAAAQGTAKPAAVPATATKHNSA